MNRLVVIGNFDGVHRGHQNVLAQAKQDANNRSLTPSVLTFWPHPASVLGGRAPAVLTPPERKRFLLESLGFDVITHPFDLSFAALTPRAFAEQLLRDTLQVGHVVVGDNFRFGKSRAGDVHTLQALGDELGFDVKPSVLVGDDKGPWSSSRARAHLAAAELRHVTTILGRPHQLEGVVVEGFKRGRTIGFPTANLSEIQQALPPAGVYAVTVEHVKNAGQTGEFLAKGVMNIGTRPTFAAGFSVEVHLLDWSGDLYSQRLRVSLVERLRDEQKFDSIDTLKNQILRDVDHARACLSSDIIAPSATMY